ncbi:DUF3592 domain-containing protein [Dactylosporangium darangshiense]|uniref:DUF3592 domain-containing protein n=1 Tax=Dactylosporangium darangshiense TaxID=579108 RepID=A0ABP8DMF1_9ACTN
MVQRDVSGPRFWSGAVFMLGLVSLLSGLDAKLWYDEEHLAAHGVTATAVVDDHHSTRYGVTVYVHFTPPGGDRVDAIVHDPPDTARLEAGSPLPVRYDPEDPAGRIEPVGADDRFTRWGLLGICVLLWVMSGRAVVGRLRGSRRR